MPSSCTSTSMTGPVRRARTVTVPPEGEYLNAFSSSWPTMMSVAIGSPLAAARSSGTSAATWCLSDSGLNDTTAARSRAPRSNGPLLTGSASAPARAPSSSCSTRRPSDPARSAIVRTAARRSASDSCSHRLASVDANPWTTVIGVRSSWLVVARNRSLASSSSLAAVTSRKSTTCSPPSPSSVQRTSIQRSLGSLWVWRSPGAGSGNGGGAPIASPACVPVIR